MTKDKSNQSVPSRAKELLRSLPSVSTLLENGEVRQWLEGIPHASVVAALRLAIDDVRAEIMAGEIEEAVSIDDVLAAAEAALIDHSMPSPVRVINATGIVLHTGLGRAPLCEAAIDAITDAAGGYCDLEYDLETGRRGHRTAHVVDHLTELTGAEAATVVNNNAAATLLILRVLAGDREVIVSRGELVEIGGSFRLPDIMAAGGAVLREVGTTNRTRIADYELAINERTAALMRVHTSNYRVVGFTEHTSIGELAELAHEHDLIAVDDLGSGALIDLTELGLPAEPVVRDSIEAGADLVCFSGDKLLGGPQCGVIVGKEALIERITSHPLMRTYRVDKMTLMALEATLSHYANSEDAVASIPTLAMLAASTDDLGPRAQALCEQLEAALPGEHFYVGSDVGFAGGGSLPARELETVVVQWRPASQSAQAMADALREAEVPVVVRVRDEAVCFDLRTIRPTDEEDLVTSVAAALAGDEEDDGEEAAD